MNNKDKTSISGSGQTDLQNNCLKMLSWKEANALLNELLETEKDPLGLGVDTGGLTSSLDAQVGGSHYKDYKIQPIEYAMANNLNYCQANAVKYVTRYRDKGGIEDLRKAIHNIEILIELEMNGRLE